MDPRAIRSGLYHWTAVHSKIRLAVSSYFCELAWDTLLLAHGLPLVGDGRQRLRAFAEG